MRVEKEYNFQGIKATLFNWNNKFLLKFEEGGYEQTYKFSELDYMIEEIEELVDERFLLQVREIFHLMRKNVHP